MLSSTVLLSLALLAGRVAGLARELSLASLFGVSRDADVAVLLLALPDLMVNLLVSGGLSAALMPRFALLDPAGRATLYRNVAAVSFVVFGMLAVVVAMFPRLVFQILAPGAVLPVNSAIVSAVALAIPLTALAGVTGAYLNSANRFFISGCGTLIFNLCVLAALLLARSPSEALWLLSFGILAGAAVRWGVQLVVLPAQVRHGWQQGFYLEMPLLRAFGAASLAAALTLLAPVFVRAIASTVGPGSIASLNYAQKLVELPIAILITSISTVALPRLSKLYAEKRTDVASHALSRDTQYALLLSLAVVLFGLVFADAAVQVLFGRGQMSASALSRVTALTKVALLGVPAVAVSSLAIADLSARQLNGIVLRRTLLSLVLLPLLAIPGIVAGSELLLMVAVVGFQWLQAALMAHVANLPLRGPGALLNNTAWKAALFIVVIAASACGVDLAAGVHSPWLRIVMAGAGFGLALSFPVRKFARARPRPTLT
jgi:putative peptidoglycan lipid II flippase